MSKSQPTSIRFDEDDLKICLFHSKQKTKQKLVDWFCRNYAELYRVKEDNPFKVEVKPLDVYDAPKIEQPKHNEPFTFQPTIEKYIKMDYNYFALRMLDLDKEDTYAILDLKKEAESSQSIKEPERRNIILALQNGTY